MQSVEAITVRTAGRDDHAAVSELRLAEYATARDFEVLDPASVAWSAQDDEALVLGAWSGDGRLLSTMRGRLFSHADLAELAALFPGYAGDLGPHLPMLLLERGATRADLRSQGLNALLRVHFVRLATELGLASLAGRAYAGAPRMTTLTQLGYTFFALDSAMDRSHVRAVAPLILAILSADAFAGAAARLEATVRTSPVLACALTSLRPPPAFAARVRGRAG